MFYGLGSDGTVGANKNSIKIIGKETDSYTQGYFVYDSKKAGTVTVSHLRFGPNPIRRPYLVSHANFLACHNFSFLEKYDMLQYLVKGGTFLLTSEYSKDEVWDKLPGRVQNQIIDKKLSFFIIDAVKIAGQLGLGARINVIMQTAFFRISAVMDQVKAVQAIKGAIEKTYGSKGPKVVEMNNSAVDKALENIDKVDYPDKPTNPVVQINPIPNSAPDFVRDVTATLLKLEGHTVKVSQMPDDGVWPTATTQYEKRNIAVNIPVWNPETCIQCHRCSLVCPHGVIRPHPHSSPRKPRAARTLRASNTRFRSPPKTARGAGTACRIVRRRTRKLSRCSPRHPFGSPNQKTGSFSSAFPTPIRSCTTPRQ
jgi:pyruvate-ferredoxin/flavodoxin oxidoreductase